MAPPMGTPDNGVRRFFSLFRNHWIEGSGRLPEISPSQKGWNPPLFHGAMHKAGCPVDADTVRLWARGHETGRPLPSRDNLVGILKVFSLSGAANTDLQQAWQHALAARQRGSPNDIMQDGPSDGWILTEDGFATDSLAEIQFHGLEATNKVDSWRLHASPVFGIREQDEFEIYMSNVTLTLVTGYTVSQATLLGEEARKHDYIQRVAGGSYITGPRDNLNRLIGNPVGDEYLAIIEPGVPGADRVTLSLLVGRRSLHVSLPEAMDETIDETSVRAKKQKALEAVLYDDRRDSQGRFVIARATRRKLAPDK